MQRPHRRIRKAGFTLMEVMFVVTIIAILAGLALPRMGDNWDRFAVRGASNQFRSAHQKARTAAIRYGAVAELHVNASTDHFWVEVDTTVAGSGVVDTVGAVIDLSEIKVDLMTTVSLVCFDARGLVAAVAQCPTTGALDVGFARGNELDTLVVTASGLLLSR